jgi:outer membrane receptor protein involved in Fe transport|tara:strand:+ start:737 stop:880 length:144 start_codon:yes stop_codon:yes gene_type:complete
VLLACGIGFANTLSALTLEEIIVTAKKRAKSLSDVPISISIVTGALL